MTLPRNKMAGWKWLHEEKDLQLIKLGRRSKVPIRGERVGRTTRRSFDSVRLDRNGNAGVHTGRISGIIVLDIDDELLFPSGYDVPDTLTVKTKKGYHHYYRLPDDDKYYGNRRRSSFDIRGEGGYVVAPWSTHPEGPIYRIFEDAEIVDAPQWLLDLSESTTTPSGDFQENREAGPSLITISEPPGFTLPHVNQRIIEEPTPKGRRSEKIWHILNELVEIDCSDEGILYIFESNPNGIGEKYHEKGAGRVNWLQLQIDKIRVEVADRYVDPVEANDQESVDSVTGDIKNFIGASVRVTEEHEQSIREFVNLLISLYEGSINGWYAIPMPVGGGKTQTILHFIKFLYKNDENRSFPISVAFEKISEIDSAAEWLKEHEVPDEFYQVVHHEVPGIFDIIQTLPNIPVILHTHQKLSGSSYVDDYFKYDEQIRKLLIFDESMLNAMVHSDSCRDISAKLSTLSREYNVDQSFQEKLPSEIHQFFKAFNELIERVEKELKASPDKEMPLPPVTRFLDGFTYGELVKYSRIIEGKLGETDLYRNILLVSSAPAELRKMTLIKGQGRPALFVTKELLDQSINNLITTDASREFRRLFRYTQRTDGKKVRIYNTDNFRWDDELGVRCYEENSGKESIRKAFEDDSQSNPYLKKITEIIKNDNEYWRQNNLMAGRRGPDNLLEKPKYLFFHSKQIKTIPCQVKLKLLEEGLILPNEINERLFFETFGRETATDEYKDCEVIIFIGLLHKPSSAIDALLAGEGFTGDVESVRQEVEIGEFLHQLQQGIGRGRLRQGKEQFVHFFHPTPDIFRDDLWDAFPVSNYNGHSVQDYVVAPLFPDEVEGEIDWS